MGHPGAAGPGLGPVGPPRRRLPRAGGRPAARLGGARGAHGPRSGLFPVPDRRPRLPGAPVPGLGAPSRAAGGAGVKERDAKHGREPARRSPLVWILVPLLGLALFVQTGRLRDQLVASRMLRQVELLSMAALSRGEMPRGLVPANLEQLRR